jgi:hypothetical protein
MKSIDGIHKVCITCKQTKLVSDFNKNSQRADGYQHQCRACLKEYKDSLHYEVSIIEKVCNGCGLVKLASEFGKDKRDITGLRSNCNRCQFLRQCAYKKTEAGKAAVRRHSYKGLRFGHSRNKAKQRDIEWTITREEFDELKKKPCEYCGYPIVTTGSGLDRIDNKIGYIITNVVPCCYLCNTMKWKFWTYSEMKLIGKLVKELLLARAVSANNI